MADSKISALASGAPAQAGDEYIVARSGANYKLTLTNIAANMPATTIPSGNLVVSSGFFGVGNTVMSTINAVNGVGDIVVGSGSGDGGLTVYTGTAGTGGIAFADGTTTTDTYRGYINYAHGTDHMAFWTSATERVRIDSSGNVGIGGTAAATAKVQVLGILPSSGTLSFAYHTTATIPSSTTGAAVAYHSKLTTDAASFTLGTLAHILVDPAAKGAGSTITNQMGFYAESTLTGATNNYGFYSNIASGSNRWNFYAAGTANNYFAGDVKIGTASTPSTGVHLQKTSGNTYYRAQNGTANADFGIDSAGNGILWNNSNYPLLFGTNNAERMRVTSGGNVLIGTTADLGSNARVDIQSENAEADVLAMRYFNAAAGKHWRFNIDSNSRIYLINQAGTGVYINDGDTSWTGTSDERVKTALTPIENAASKVSTLRAVTGRYTSDSESVSRAFLIAQDVQKVLPEAVDVPENESDPLGLRYTDVVPLLVAAIKELTARVAELEAK